MNSLLALSTSIDAVLFQKILSKFPKQWHGMLSDWSDWCNLQTSVVFGDFRTSRNGIVLEKPILDQLAKKFFVFYGIRRFITLSARSRRWSHLFYSHLRFGLPAKPHALGFPTECMHQPVYSYMLHFQPILHFTVWTSAAKLPVL